MKKYSFVIFIISALVFSNSINAQKIVVSAAFEHPSNKANSDTIYYVFNQKLNWSDFQGKPGTQFSVGAVTASGFAFHSSMDYSNNVLNIRIGVYAFFTKHDSWKKPNINSDYHLEHEQHHFDISCLGAQKFVEEIKSVKFTSQNYQQLLDSLFSKVYDENIKLQDQYDRETKNSIDVKKQIEWNKKISDMISKVNKMG